MKKPTRRPKHISLPVRPEHPRDVTFMFSDRSGFTPVCSSEPNDVAVEKLTTYCTRRKYRQKADRWFGMCLTPGDSKLRFGLRLSDPWVQNNAMDAETSNMIEPLPA
jgi:hypothetical protein